MAKYILLFIFIFLPINVFAITVDKCIDGDTVRFNDNNKLIAVRLLAVDTPELSKENELSYTAKDYTCNLLLNAKVIRLESDPLAKEDRYGRSLLWVYADDILLQKALVSKGYAIVAYIYDDYKYVDELYIIENKARLKKLGIWTDSSTEINILILITTILILILSILKTLKKFF